MLHFFHCLGFCLFAFLFFISGKWLYFDIIISEHICFISGSDISRDTLISLNLFWYWYICVHVNYTPELKILIYFSLTLYHSYGSYLGILRFLDTKIIDVFCKITLNKVRTLKCISKERKFLIDWEYLALLKFCIWFWKRNIDSKTVGHNVKMMTSSENIGTLNNACQMNVYQTF